MSVIDIISIVFGLAGFGCAVWFYVHLYRWARQCQGARIAIAYKGKVKTHAPITEWLAWVSMLDKDEQSNGRVLYKLGGTTVAITKRAAPANRFKRFMRKRKQATKPGKARVAA